MNERERLYPLTVREEAYFKVEYREVPGSSRPVPFVIGPEGDVVSGGAARRDRTVWEDAEQRNRQCHFSEFFPEGAGKETRGTFCVEIHNSGSGRAEDGFVLTLWGRSSGAPVGHLSIRDLHKARLLAKRLYKALLPEFEATQAREEIRSREWDEKRKAEWEERQRVEAEERERLFALVTPETERVTTYRCPLCDHGEETEDPWTETPAYECSRCSDILVGEDGRRCPNDNIFTARIQDAIVCPNCEEVLDEMPEPVTGVVVEGRFFAEADLPEDKRADQRWWVSRDGRWVEVELGSDDLRDGERSYGLRADEDPVVILGDPA